MSVRNFCRIAYPIYHQQICATQVRSYARWMNRRPANVLLPYESICDVNLKKEKVIDLTASHSKKDKSQVIDLTASNVKHTLSQSTDHITKKNEIKEKKDTEVWTENKSEQVKNNKKEKLKKRQFLLNQQKVFDDKNEIIYEKLRENDDRVSSLFVQMKSKKERGRSGMTLVEGWRLITDGLEAKCKLRYLIFSQSADLEKVKEFLPKTGVKIYKMSYNEMQLWSDTETSPGLIGIFEAPKPDNIKMLSKPMPLQLLCDNIRVPGNLGALLRVAVGAGCEKVLLSKGCVDVWDPKVIRSAAGAHFRLPIYHSIDWEEMPKLLESDTSIFIADSNEKISLNEESESTMDIIGNMSLPLIPYYGVEYSTHKHITLIIGGETEGISQESYELAVSKSGIRVNIPLQKGVDSLNTGMAAAVIAFEVKKQIMMARNEDSLQRNIIQQ